MLFAGPLPIVSTGKRIANSRSMSVPSFCAKNVTGRRPLRSRAPPIAFVTPRATSMSDAFRTVAFSRSSRPSEPIWELREIEQVAELLADDLLGRALVLVGDGREDARDRDRVRSAGDLAGEPRDRLGVERGRARARRTRSRRRTIRSPAETASRSSAGQPKSGRTACVAGPPKRSTPTRRRPRRSRTAFVACVVPNIACVIRLRSTVCDDAGDRALDARRHVGRRRHLRLREETVVGVEHDGVRVRAAHVDAEAKVRRGHAGPPPARSRGRSRSAAAPRARGRAPFARSDRTGTRSRSPAARTGGARSRSRSRTASRAP